MLEKNIHGTWELRFENRIVISKVHGATNQEASQAWLQDVKNLVESSNEGLSVPWALLQDMSDWGIATLDMWERVNKNVDWMLHHNCSLVTIVFTKQIQKFAFDKGITNQSIVRFSFDYDEAYQTCLKALQEDTKD
ncbi:hypothetical protein L4C34_00045 [Vibrio profundum]|uniref:hypothetical protein n=1 Tax=Vibrio profundum TaxID=2910247 RepID=UPI003D0E9E1B